MHRWPHLVPRLLGRIRLALARLAWAHVHETLIWASKSKRACHTFNYDLLNSLGSQLTSVLRVPTVPKREKLHGYPPTQKPLKLVHRAILASTQEGDLVLDPFCGSGTTAVAAKELNRFFVGTDMEREFCELAGRRIEATAREHATRDLPHQSRRRSGSNNTR
jgi:site-specific DNA-methyltransferase (adenine-specific)